MNKYTPELIEEYAKAAEGFNEPTIGRMLRDYATLLRERESAKAAVTDEMIEYAARAMQRKFDPSSSLEDMTANGKWRRFVDEATCCLEAVAALLRERRSVKVDERCPECGAPCEASHHVFESGDELHEYRYVAPMLTSALVLEERQACGDISDYEEGYSTGWNDYRDAVLAAAPKPEK